MNGYKTFCVAGNKRNIEAKRHSGDEVAGKFQYKALPSRFCPDGRGSKVVGLCGSDLFILLKLSPSLLELTGSALQLQAIDNLIDSDGGKGEDPVFLRIKRRAFRHSLMVALQVFRKISVSKRRFAMDQGATGGFVGRLSS